MSSLRRLILYCIESNFPVGSNLFCQTRQNVVENFRQVKAMVFIEKLPDDSRVLLLFLLCFFCVVKCGTSSC